MSLLGGLFGGGSNGAGAAARAATQAEKQRQALINQGMTGINAVYGGGSFPTYTQVGKGAAFDPSAQYYTAPSAGKYNPLAKQKDNAASYNNRMSKNRALYIQGPTQTFTGFQPDFFNQAAQTYTNYALPQLAQQYKVASDATTYDLAGKGLLNSSVASQARSNLDLTMGQQKLNIADTGRQQSQALQKQVEDSRQQAINNLYQTGDPTQAIQSAIGQASQIQAPSFVQPLTNAFSGIMNQYALNQLYPMGGQQTQPVGYGYGGYGSSYNPYYSAPTMNFNTPPAYY